MSKTDYSITIQYKPDLTIEYKASQLLIKGIKRILKTNNLSLDNKDPSCACRIEIESLPKVLRSHINFETKNFFQDKDKISSQELDEKTLIKVNGRIITYKPKKKNNLLPAG